MGAKPSVPVEPEVIAMPTSFMACTVESSKLNAPSQQPRPPPQGLVCTLRLRLRVCALQVMWFIHGFILDIVVIGVLPFLSVKASDAQRADKFPWALGGYKGFDKVPNLAPTHRRFIAENAAYALLRIAPAFFITNLPVLMMCVLSYFIEGLTIAWEITSHSAPPNAMVPQTLMGVFASAVTYTATMNADGYIKDVDPTVLMVLQGACAMTWVCWLCGAVSTATK